jgi:predicted ATPase
VNNHTVKTPLISEIITNFAIGRRLSATTFRLNKKRYAHLAIGNLSNRLAALQGKEFFDLMQELA